MTDRRFLTWLAYRLENAGTEKPETVQRLRQIAGTGGAAERIIGQYAERETLAQELAELLAGSPGPETATEPTIKLKPSMVERIIEQLGGGS